MRDHAKNRAGGKRRYKIKAAERRAEKARLGCKCPRAHRIDCPLYKPRTRAAIPAGSVAAIAAPVVIKPDAARLSDAMTRAGVGPRALARLLECHHSTIGQVKRGSLRLDVAAGGALLTWVEGAEKSSP